MNLSQNMQSRFSLSIKEDRADGTIHSGQFMVSNLEDDDSDTRRNRPNQNGPKFHNRQRTQTFAIDVTLTNVFENMSLAYSDKITSPKWKPFKGTKLTVKDKVRLNNIIWREWTMQYIYERSPIICQFAAPFQDNIHIRPESVVLEGKYWKRRFDSVTNEYKKCRRYFKQLACRRGGIRFCGQQLSDADLLSRVEQIYNYVDDFQQYSPDINKMIKDEDFSMDFSDSLFTDIDKPFDFPCPRELNKVGYRNAQPGLVQLQPNLNNPMEPLLNVFHNDKSQQYMDTQTSGSSLYLPSTVVKSEDPDNLLLMTDDSNNLLDFLMTNNLSRFCPPGSFQDILSNDNINMNFYHQSQNDYNMLNDSRLTTVDNSVMLTEKTSDDLTQFIFKDCILPNVQIPMQQRISATASSNIMNAVSAPGFQTSHARGLSVIPKSSIFSQKSCSYSPPGPTCSGDFADNKMSVLKQLIAEPAPNFIKRSSTNKTSVPVVSSANLLTTVTKFAEFAVPKTKPIKPKPPASSEDSPTYLKQLLMTGSYSQTQSNVQHKTSTSLTRIQPRVTNVIQSNAKKLPYNATRSILPNTSELRTAVKCATVMKRSNSKPRLFYVSSQPTSPPTLTSSLTNAVPRVIHNSDLSNTADISMMSPPPDPERTTGTERRNLHITAEKKRRLNIEVGFDTLSSIIPSLRQSVATKVSKATMLQKTADYIRKLKQDKTVSEKEKQRLLQNRDSLNTAILHCQSQLPETGVPISAQRAGRLKDVFTDYLQRRSLQNWKFFIYGMFIESLFDSYNTMVTTNHSELHRTVTAWLEYLSLPRLRQLLMASLLKLTSNTSILSDPNATQDEIIRLISRHNETDAIGYLGL